MRESYRLQKNNLRDELAENQKKFAVFFLYTSNELLKYEVAFEKIGGALKRLEAIAAAAN